MQSAISVRVHAVPTACSQPDIAEEDLFPSWLEQRCILGSSPVSAEQMGPARFSFLDVLYAVVFAKIMKLALKTLAKRYLPGVYPIFF